jgi:3-hydroxyisobutyrate dehydrogenase
LPQDRLLAVLTAGAAHSWFLEKRGASMLRDDFTPGFKLGLLRKDLEIVQALAEELGAELPVVNQALADYRALQAAGYGDEEISALIRRKRALFTAP